jgi:hypothetical protein
LVIDYKSGGSVYGPAFADQGALQVPLYMLVLQSLRPGTQVAGGFYAALGAGTRGGMVREGDAEAAGGWAARKSICTDDRFEAELAAVLVAAKAAAAGIREGVVVAEPAVECPRHCDLGALCRSQGRGRTT